MLVLAASLLFTAPVPLEMPRAEAFLVTETNGVRKLEDRYQPFDLWLSQVVDGRWVDAEGRSFIHSTLRALPRLRDGESALTRSEFERLLAVPELDREDLLFIAIAALSPIKVDTEYEPAERLPRGMKAVRYYQGTNHQAIVCAYLKEQAECWSVATWTLAAEDDFDERLKAFETELFRGEGMRRLGVTNSIKRVRHRRAPALSERELLCRDLRHSVTSYPNWHFTASEEFAIIDALGAERSLTETLTNSIPAWRGRFAAVVPTPIDGSNVLAVARIFASRDDYLEVVGEELAWSAAYWSPMRRELVAYLPEGGRAELLKTFRHELFHQYLSYATAMIPASPWFNEGYAQYFEDEDSSPSFAEVENVESLRNLLAQVLLMDYEDFYAGEDKDRRLKYDLAWSVAVFIERGAPLVRFEPFKRLKRDYLEALLVKHDMREATAAVLGDPDLLKQFLDEWEKFILNM